MKCQNEYVETPIREGRTGRAEVDGAASTGSGAWAGAGGADADGRGVDAAPGALPDPPPDGRAAAVPVELSNGVTAAAARSGAAGSVAAAVVRNVRREMVMVGERLVS